MGWVGGWVGEWEHTSDDSYMYQLSLVVAIAITIFIIMAYILLYTGGGRCFWRVVLSSLFSAE